MCLSFIDKFKLHVGCFTQIYKIRNPRLEHLYSVCKAHMRRTNPGLETIEEILWHGTTEDACDNICRDGFNRAHCGKNGENCYFKL